MTQSHEARIDQDPRNQKQLDTEPSYDGTPFVANREVNEISLTKLAVKVGAAAIIVAGIFGVWQAKKFNDSADDILREADTSNSASPFPGSYNSAPPTTIYIEGDNNKDGALSKAEIQSLDPITNREAVENVDVKSLVSAYASDLDAWRQDAYDIMNKRMTKEQSGVITMPSVNDKLSYSDQDVINAVAIDTADASVQDNNPAEGQRMLPLIMDKNCPGFDEYFDKIPNDKMIINAAKQTGRELPRPTESFMQYDLKDVAQARIIKWENIPGPHESSEMTYQRYALYVLNENEGNSTWQLVNKWETDNIDVVREIESLQI